MQRTVLFVWLNVFVLAACVWATFAARAAHAVNNCTDAAYVAAFVPALAGRTCEEVVARVPIPYRGSGAIMRILRMPEVEMDARANATVAMLRRVAARVGAAMDEMGGVEVHDVSILLTGFTDDPDDPDGALATALWPNSAYPDQCLVAMYLGDYSREIVDLEFAIAHEIFHCIQFRTWNLDPDSSNAFWWMEGSAEYFAALAIPDVNGAGSSVADFDELSATQSLLAMDYENVVLFSWVDAHMGGPRGVKHTLDTLSEGRTMASQREVAARAFIADNLRRFAQDYIDGVIPLPNGRAMGSRPRLPTQDADRPLQLSGEPFVLTRGQINFAPALYVNRIDIRQGRYETAREPRNWAALPTNLDIPCDSEVGYAFAAISGDEAGVDIEITHDNVQERTCAPCGGPAPPRAQHNSCLIGTWHFAGHQNFCDAFAERLSAGGARMLSCDPGTGEVTFTADGVATASATGQNVLVQLNPDMTMHVVQAIESRANWSAEAGEIQFCGATSSLTGVNTITARGRATSNAIDESSPPSTGAVSFACTRTTLTITSHEAPGAFLGVGPEMVLQRVR
ncbi:MAG: hypothetical protein ACT4OF_15210 [Caulobacteraceae bacterium]